MLVFSRCKYKENAYERKYDVNTLVSLIAHTVWRLENMAYMSITPWREKSSYSSFFNSTIGGCFLLSGFTGFVRFCAELFIFEY